MMMLFNTTEIPFYARFRIPGIVAGADGTLLAYCEARKTDDDWADIDILLRISHDGGRTFSEPAVLASGAKVGKTVNNPVMIASRDGLLHFLYCVEYGLETAGGGVFYRKSTDDGATWSEPRDISAMTSPELRNVFATGPGHGIELADGTLFVPCWTVLKIHGTEPRSHHPGSVCCLVSKDKGRTWEIGSFVPNGEVSDPNETAAAQLPDGTIVLTVRDGATRCRCYAAAKEGLSFSPIRKLPDVPDPVCCAGMVADGDKLYLTNCGSDRERIDLTLQESRDGILWENARIIVPGPAGYSDIAISGSTLFVACEKGTGVVLTSVPIESSS